MDDEQASADAGQLAGEQAASGGMHDHAAEGGGGGPQQAAGGPPPTEPLSNKAPEDGPEACEQSACVRPSTQTGEDGDADGGAEPLTMTAPEDSPEAEAEKGRTLIQRLNEFYQRHKGRKAATFSVLDEDTKRPTWVCQLELTGGLLAGELDQRLPDASFEGTGGTKKAAELDASKQAWEALMEGGFVTAASTAPATQRNRHQVRCGTQHLQTSRQGGPSATVQGHTHRGHAVWSG